MIRFIPADHFPPQRSNKERFDELPVGTFFRFGEGRALGFKIDKTGHMVYDRSNDHWLFYSANAMSNTPTPDDHPDALRAVGRIVVETD